MKTHKEILELAKKAAENSYSPYSKFAVGSCAVYESGREYFGCNIENSSYGLSLCAERNAISTAIASGEKSNLVQIAVYSPKKHLCYPCGACLQWLQEFSSDFDIQIVLEDRNYQPKMFYLKDMLPFSFGMP